MTLANICKELTKCQGYKPGQSAAEFRKANPEAAMRLAQTIEGNKAAIVSELVGAIMATDGAA